MSAALAVPAIDCIGTSDALYHNVEHTMLVTLVGYENLKGMIVGNGDKCQRFRAPYSRLSVSRHSLGFAVFFRVIAPTAILFM